MRSHETLGKLLCRLSLIMDIYNMHDRAIDAEGGGGGGHKGRLEDDRTRGD